MITLFLLLNSPSISAQLQLYCCLAHVITDLWTCPLVAMSPCSPILIPGNPHTTVQGFQ